MLKSVNLQSPCIDTTTDIIITSEVVQFDAGGNLTACLMIEIVNETTFEGSEIFTVDISAAVSGLTVGMPSRTIVEIIDPEGTSFT